ncbi:reverse transcriptase/maturase family protein [Aneurinibacillus aneurinilyticus]|uniref:Putative group II intron-encoded protein LtrA n=1 Tax=Aneurinibacillus aneurinilyticus ATCC 12856 TaxID=649747 RepID=U1XXY2_ANEAE|nr:reverse transcriptase/maturase family protein [Aneurinibacillus aneurinilyticus]ERI04852.1 putative group II intron-encoded protein LtrA [Aneurinibacillus aneurinilyticus ATCC 12856]MED0706013.1 reverse transcriptase domain-containing protein [Aneurinibacillus aneurinilyticus]MED0725541.1 reverse transcriptase domain-containing protein [Aneurinibacillus aneurinilyticus]MED0730933.1 reverse transcriptase domain-containing protein [Aneurinibacillus aneurinilyticus]MED0742926.1 reverse transcr
MRSPTVVLNSLASKSKDADYKYRRLYRNLYNPHFYLEAYAKIYANEGNMTAGTDGKTIDGMNIERVNQIIARLQDFSYQPQPAKRTYIPKKNGGKRPLGIPSFDDKLVQEVVRRILEAIYEGTFSDRSHGFRPNRSCHTALIQIQATFTAVKWFVEGDIKGFFDNIDHHVLINILRKRIEDEKFLDLIWKFLKAGYMEDWQLNKTYSGTPQGGVISPILSNIYLNELDQYVEKYKKTFDKGIKRAKNTMYKTACQRADRLKAKYKQVWDTMNEEEKLKATKELKELQKVARQYPSADPFDEGYRRLQYVRYADDFLIGIIGTKEEAQQIKKDLTVFLKEELKLELSQEKTLITHSSKKAHFLSYDIDITRHQMSKRNKNGHLQRVNNQRVRLMMPKEAWQKNLLKTGTLKITKNDEWESTHRRYLVNNDDLEIISIYNAEIRGLYNYYKLALNVHSLNKYKHFMKYSFLKTLANKYKSTVGKMADKYKIDGQLAVRYQTKEGQKIRYFYNEGFKKQKLIGNNSQDIDKEPIIQMYSGRTSLIDRLLANQCEWCKTENMPLHMHHVKKLKDLAGKKRWEQHMIARNRKTMAICEPCHRDLHAGRLD